MRRAAHLIYDPGTPAERSDPLNAAFRVEKLADEVNPILLDDATRRLVEATFQLRSIGSHRLEGRAGAEPLFALEGIRGGPGGSS